MIVPGGGLSLDGAHWVASRSNFLVHVNVLLRLFRGKMLAMLMHAHDAGQLTFFNTHAGLADKRTFKRFIAPLRQIKWVVYCKAPFAGPEQVLRYLSRYTHRVAISNRLVAADDAGIAFRWKDYRINGPGRWKTMRLHPHEFIRRFLLHVLPKGVHRIRYIKLKTLAFLPNFRANPGYSPETAAGRWEAFPGVGATQGQGRPKTAWAASAGGGGSPDDLSDRPEPPQFGLACWPSRSSLMRPTTLPFGEHVIILVFPHAGRAGRAVIDPVMAITVAPRALRQCARASDWNDPRWL